MTMCNLSHSDILALAMIKLCQHVGKLWNLLYRLQEKQLKKIRAKQRRLQAVLSGEDIQKLEAELLTEDDTGEDEIQPRVCGWTVPRA